MKGITVAEYPQIIYHITYDESLTLKDFEDLINLIRISNNDALQKMGISRSKGNDLQRIEKIEPGSIQLIMTIIEVVSNIVSAGHFVEKIKEIITNKIRNKRDRLERNPREDRKVYEKREITVNIEGQTDYTIVISIHIHN